MEAFNYQYAGADTNGCRTCGTTTRQTTTNRQPVSEPCATITVPDDPGVGGIDISREAALAGAALGAGAFVALRRRG